jgi:serine/threonine protein kinase
MDAPPLLPRLPGYDNLELIAHGTTALVFRATQTRLNRLVAIKVITIDTGEIPSNAARELATTVALSSQPHIVSIIDTGVTEDERPYIVMEYCEGGSYALILRHGGPLPVDDVVEVGTKIGEALHAAHQVGIVHRDVKPSNILRSRFGPALTDFGIARAPDELGSTLTREMMTPHHASPEALLHQAQSAPSDVYSLASTMWTLLAGHPPFAPAGRPAIDLVAFRDRVLHEPLPPLPRDDVPPWLRAQLERAMAKLPAERHGSALEFSESLRRGVLGLPAVTPATRPVIRSAPTPPLPRSPLPESPPPRSPLPESPPPRSPHGSAADSVSPELPSYSEPAAPPSDDQLEPDWTAGAALSHMPASADADAQPSAPAIDEGGGWLSSSETERPAPDRWIEPAPRRRGGRRALVASTVVGLLLIVVVGAAALLSDELLKGRPEPTPTPDPTRFITASAEGAPRDVRLVDNGTSVTLTWKDPTPGTVQFIIRGQPVQGSPLPLRNAGAGTTTITYAGLDRATNYCFVVVAVYTTETVAPASPVCTTR